MLGYKTNLTDEQIQRILWYYDKGASIDSIRARFETSYGRIKKILEDHEVLRKKDPKKDKDIEIKELYSPDPVEGKICKGMSYAQYLKKAGYKN